MTVRKPLNCYGFIDFEGDGNLVHVFIDEISGPILTEADEVSCEVSCRLVVDPISPGVRSMFFRGASMTYEAKIWYQVHGDPIQACGCRYCGRAWSNLMDDLDPDGWMKRINSGGFILCPDCGCKRCPRATYHGHECTGSNEPGQAGSVYGDFVLPSFKDEDEE